MAQNTDALKRQLDFYAGPTLTVMLKARRSFKNQTTKPKIIAGLAEAISDEAGTREAFEALNEPQKMLLRVLREQGGSSTINALKVAANTQGLSHFDQNLHELMRRALVLFTTPGNVRHELWRAADGRRSNWNLNADYAIAGVELALELAGNSIELPRATHILQAYDAEPFAIEEQSPATLLRAVWSIVRWASERKITLTKTTNALRKADLKVLEALLQESIYLKGFAMALAFEAGLLEQQREKIEVAPDAPEFFARAPREQIEKLCHAWIRLQNWSEFFRIAEIETENHIVPRANASSWSYEQSDVPNDEALPAARAYLIGLLKRAGRATPGQWQSLASLRSLVETENPEFLISRQNQRGYYGGSSGTDFYRGFWPTGGNRWRSLFHRGEDWDKVEGRFLRQMLCEPLRWLGLVAIARDAANEVVAFRLSPSGAHLLGLADEAPAIENSESEKPLIILPNFEIMAYTEAAHLPVLYQLERFATRERAERVAHYKLDRDSVYRGLQDGLSAREMREFLERHSRSGLPQNIAYSLDDWQKLWERVAVRASASIVEAESEAELDAFLATLPTDGATKLAPCWAVIEPRYVEVARNILESRGARGFDYSIETEQAFTTSESLEIAVPTANLDLWLRAKLEQFADEAPAVKGKARYQITRASVERAAKNGVKAEAILEFLRETGTPPLAANVTLSVRGWGGAVKPVALGSMQILVAAPAVIEQLASIEELKPLLWLGLEGAILVNAADVPKLKTQLKQRGISFDGQAETHLKAPQPLPFEATPRRLKPAQRSIEVGMKRVTKRTLVAAHPDESEVDLQVGLSESEVEDLLETAMEKSLCVVIEYQSKVRLALRKINPLRFIEDGGHSYIGAWDHWRKGDRIFRLDRITRIALLDERFDPERFG